LAEWQIALIIILGAFLLLMATGLPIAFVFLLINLVGVFMLWGGEAGITQLLRSIRESVSNFNLVPIPLYILMGEIMFHSGVSTRMVDTVDKWIGKLPGRLSLVAVGGGTLFATLSGSGMASCAMLGSTLLPDMKRRGYQNPMSLGPIMGSAGLAIMIPPSSMGVLVATIGQFSVGKLLVAIVVPGLMMAITYAAYIIIRASLQPKLAPVYETPEIPLSDKLISTARYILPLAFIIFLVLGVIFLGIATPSESAALGCVGSFILAAFYKGGLSWEKVRKSFLGTVRVSVMVFLIISGANAFSQILSFTGATEGLVQAFMSIPGSPLIIVALMMIVVLIMGCFMECTSIMMITLPIFMPVILSLNLDPVWFGAMFLLNMEMAAISPPFGLTLFVMKGVAGHDTTMGEVYRAGIPFLGLNLVVMALMLFFPIVTQWLPSMMIKL
jgi:tripartite ATP-independent transporter DctM subunit